MIVQIVSDIHLEKNKGITFQDLIQVQGDVLCLLGDIGCPLEPSYRAFLQECHTHFKHTVLIAGNHEYWRSSTLTITEVDALIDVMCSSFTNIHYLSNGTNKVIDGVNFIGATLWTLVTEGSTAFTNEQIVELDNTWKRRSWNSVTPWGIVMNNKVHLTQLQAIETKINWGYQHKLKNVVLTHHAPLIRGPFKRVNMPTDLLYGRDLSYAMNGQYIKAWCFGHTHCNYENTMNGTYVASNQYGSGGVEGWSKAFTFSV
jgi:predicted phosphohydrolase